MSLSWVKELGVYTKGHVEPPKVLVQREIIITLVAVQKMYYQRRKRVWRLARLLKKFREGLKRFETKTLSDDRQE